MTDQPKDVALTSNQSTAVGSYIPTQSDWSFMVQWGQQAIKSKMLPTAINTPEAAAIIILKGRELGLPFMTSISHIHVINGKPCMSAELIQGLARKNLPGLVINILESDSNVAKIEFIRPEKGSKPFIQSFSIEDAKRAELLRNPTWTKYPTAMLWSRAVTAGLRKICPEALMGVSYTPEELGANVDEEGNVIETTGRHVTASQAPKPPQTSSSSNSGTQASSEKEMDLLKRKVEGQKIKHLKTELDISDDEMKVQVFGMFKTDDFRVLTLAQLGEITSILESEKQIRAQAPKTTIQPNEQASLMVDAPWLNE